MATASTMNDPISPIATTTTSSSTPFASLAAPEAPARIPSPQELDGSPITHPPHSSLAAAASTDHHQHRRGSSAEPGAEVEGYEELMGMDERQMKAWREKREKMREEREKDPAVVVNIPNVPAAIEYEAAHSHGRPETIPPRAGSEEEEEKREIFNPVLPVSERGSGVDLAGRGGARKKKEGGMVDEEGGEMEE